DARSQGKTHSLPPPVQFADFAAWQRDQMSGGRWNDQLAYWQARLEDAPPPAEFPSDWPRPPVQTFRGAQFRVPLDAVFADLLAARTALFNTFFDSYDRPFPSYQSDAVRVECEHVISNGTCKFDVVALVIPGSTTAPTLLWDYNTDLFSEETASRMLRHFLAL